ncbi:uncharacterized protein LOC108601515 [Drosophila busckii]|uniref:uncharacterized protein LOC108601515 n=1 Tax=Drosophila busckii TaxID=30019 RepID=UPI00083ECE69|nr:uncharacterized protein LOC108601515 [Drosophila busckii]
MNASDGVYAELYAHIYRYNFSGIFYFANEQENQSCQIEKWLPIAGSTIPTLIWRTFKTAQLNLVMNEELLVLACLPAVYRQDLLKTLVTNFGDTNRIYSFDAYPAYELHSVELKGQYLFEDKTYNLKGYKMLTLPDLSEPNTILYYDKHGTARMLGYVWQMLTAFCHKHKADLQLALEPKHLRPLTQIQVLDLARDGIVDLPASVQPLAIRYPERYHEYAYPATVAGWCTMLPLESLISVPSFYSWLLPVATLSFLVLLGLIYLLLQERWRRLKLAWLVLAMWLTCTIVGSLSSLFIAPPTERQIDSFQALSDAKLHIFGLRAEYNNFDFDMRTKYASAFRLTDKMSELIAMRNSLNTSFAYTVTYSKWLLYAAQQAHLPRPLFRFSQDICYYQHVPFALVIPEDSPHRVHLQRFMLQLGESGLFKHWISNSYHYMQEAGRLNYKPQAQVIMQRQEHGLAMEDLYGLIKAFAIGLVVSTGLFISELLLYRFRVWAGYVDNSTL